MNALAAMFLIHSFLERLMANLVQQYNFSSQCELKVSHSQKGHSSCLYESEKSENVSSCVLVPPKLLYTLFL